jgi:FkbH-like protein
MQGLWWLPDRPDWSERFKVAQGEPVWSSLVDLAGSRLDFLQTVRLDRLLRSFGTQAVPDGCAFAPIRLAVLASCTVDQLLPGLRVAALRRGFWLTTYVCDYGQYQRELFDAQSGLHKFAPNAVLFSFDAAHLTGRDIVWNDPDAVIDSALARLTQAWRQAKEAFGCQVIQQTLLPTALPLMGSNEHRLPGAPAACTLRLNARLREYSEKERADILALDEYAARDGIEAWHSVALWHRAKQDVSPAAAPVYGDLAVRLIAARRGRSAKCLVLDLDNTLWGGVIGDDGLDGIVLGQGSAAGEAFVDFQKYAKSLAERGIILAVCSKNDPANAMAPFEKHPDMILRRPDIASFVSNWGDKATNLRRIANDLNIGVDALVFADDNPFERNIVRRELPMVMVPELPDDPALYSHCLSAAGYFEALEITPEDLARTHSYQAARSREELRESATDLAGYLQSLDMQLVWKPFDRVGLQRIVQLINKTNQFNLTTRRYTEAEIVRLLEDENILSLQLRLTDKFGDHGIIGIVIARPAEDEAYEIETWLMSCRVLGRGVEEATANVLVGEALRRGARTLTGRYKPSEKNGMVKDHYAKLGFSKVDASSDAETVWREVLDRYKPKDTFIRIIDGRE